MLDPDLSRRIIANQRALRGALLGRYYDLQGALALVSDTPIEDWNHLEGFTTDEAGIEGLLDIGFALLRAFDQPPAVYLTPFDQPASTAGRLAARFLVEDTPRVSMALRGDAGAFRTNGDVAVERLDPAAVREFSTVVAAGDDAWVEPFLRANVQRRVHDARHAFYLARLDGRPAGATLLFSEDATAGLYFVATAPAQRGRGVATTLLARAIEDARRAGSEVIALECLAGGDAHRLCQRLGFQPAHEASLWVQPARTP
jgi:GNAT superfamily N-acetyltransferase